MSTPFATVQDVRDRTKIIITIDDEPFVETLLDDASIYIRGQFRTIDADILAGLVSEESVRSVTARMVKRVLESGPDGVKSDGAGPFSVTYDNPNGNLYLTAAEKDLLTATSAVTAMSVYQ